MKRFLSHSLHAGLTATLMMVASTQSLLAEELDVMGNLEAKGRIQVLTDNAPAPIKLADTTYAYFPGDIIKTGEGTGILKITGLGSVGLAPDTEASVRKTEAGVSVDLSAGAMAYSLAPGSDVTVNASGMRVKPSRSSLQEVNAGAEKHITGWIRIGEDGRVEVGSRSGRVEVRRDGSVQVVEAGQKSVVQFQGGRLIATQAGGGAAAGGGGGIGMENLILLVMAAGGAAIGLTLSGDDDEPLASP